MRGVRGGMMRGAMMRVGRGGEGGGGIAHLVLLLERLHRLLEVGVHLLLLEPLLPQLTHLLVQRGVAARRAHLLLLVVEVVIEVVVLVVLLLLAVVLVVGALGPLALPLHLWMGMWVVSCEGFGA